MATLIKCAEQDKKNQTITEIEPKNGKTFELREMYKLINCTMVEFIYFDNQILIIDEEGKLNHKPLNDIATYLYRKNKKIHDIIVGDALLVDRNQIK